MEPRVYFLGFDTRRAGRQRPKEAGKAACRASKGAGELRKGQPGLSENEVEGNRASHRDTSAPAPKGT